MTAHTRRAVLTALGSAAAGWPALRRETRTATAEPDAFGALLTGANERPPVQTDALGFAVFSVGPDEERIDYWLVVAGIEDVDEAHIHKGPPDLNGNVVAYLFGPAPEPVSKTGLLSSGALNDDEMIWPLTDAAEMADQMHDENVYVNVHTTAHPSGEIRGQIRSLDT
ncbi:CHRD domain-containing protein [Halorussus lipolyticus]|uniref:CHRD domain-containing protein n=1 Tax=Halorussus lipolyticus TaxID=3034024 RepID=UPI0023E79CA4|nr:CHRD domain-containing protein [Halorussus sp. DT80]